MAEEKQGILSTLLNTAAAYAPTLTQRYDYGADQPSAQDILEERIRLNRVNGSGPVNPALARNQPLTTEERLFGKNNIVANVAGSCGIVGLIVIGAVIWCFVRRH